MHTVYITGSGEGICTRNCEAHRYYVSPTEAVGRAPETAGASVAA